MDPKTFSKESLKINCADQVQVITREIQRLLASFKRRGLVLGLSGGIDSSVTAALCVRAVGRERVFGIHMPDQHSSADTLSLSQSVSTHFGFDSAVEEITGILEAVGCYARQAKAIQLVIPEYGKGWKSKIVLENVLTNQGINYFSVVAQAPDGTQVKKRLPLESYLGILAATNFKQRVRKMMEYYYADRLNFAVAGTPNRLEYDQGFFVKLGDGAADIKPIAHLYKSQVYQLAEFLGVPERIRRRPPTTDTYSLQQGQDEFYFSLPYEKLDLCLYAKNHAIPAEVVAPLVGLDPAQVERVYKDIDMKRSSTRYLHLKPQLVVPVEELNV
ncbi:MAG TPA: NAD(+) synthase [Candidatus Acidoferrum sp.]|nr:NAD(+) synthase [Candidatus Acidoferrum sp.]